jgi:hypothetical protein
VSQRVLASNEKWPDFEALNKTTPRDQWRIDFNGVSVGPHEGQNLVFLIDVKTLDRYVWASPITTIGSAICVREAIEKVEWMRQFRGEFVKPVVELADVFMPTNYRGRQRPHFIFKYWVRFGDGNRLEMLAPDNSALIAGGKQPAQQPANDNGAQTVEVPTLREVMKDEIPE